MHLEQGYPVRPLDQFHRGGVTRIHLDRVREPSPRHEIDAVHSYQPERLRDPLGEERRPLEQALVGRELRIAGGPENAATVAEPAGAEGGLSHQHAREPQRHRAAPVRREHDGPGHAGDALLEVAPPRHWHPATPNGDAVAASRLEGLHDPAAPRTGRRLGEPDAGTGEAGLADHPG